MATILYVEDNPQNRRLVRRLIEAQGWSYLEAFDGHEALTRLQSPPRPDVILMDLAMPVLDGYQTTRMIKDDRTLADIPVVALTAHALPGDRDRAKEAGCDAYLTKPIDTQEVLSTLQGFLDARAGGGGPGASAPGHAAEAATTPEEAAMEVPSANQGPLAPVLEALQELIRREGSREVSLGRARRCVERLRDGLGTGPAGPENNP